MMYLITGQPGNGKTLYALFTIEARRQLENRPVYYHGIPELTLDWTKLDNPEEWYKLPEGAIIVIDECQKTFPPRPSSSKPPVHVSEFETHRHKGFDVYLLTQHPSLVDNHLKKLAGKHLHVVRSFGMQRSDVFEMQSVQDPNARNLKDALRHQFKFPPEVYKWYKSAELHTHKRKLPWQYYAIPVALLVVIVAGWLGYRTLNNMGKTGVDAVAQVPKAGQQVSTIGQSKDHHTKTPTEYLAANSPRIPGLAYTSPIYDDITKVDAVPIPVSCTSNLLSCRCYSQQTTLLDMPKELCISIIDKGFFEPFPRKSSTSSGGAGTLKRNGEA